MEKTGNSFSIGTEERYIPLIALYKLLMQCPLCEHEFKNPKLLPCQHSFCEHCLDEIIEEIPQNEKFQCPKCCLVVDLTGDGRANCLPNNFLHGILKHVERTSVARLGKELQDKHALICKKHSSPKDIRTQHFFCENCDSFGCEVCLETLHHPRNHTCSPIHVVAEHRKQAMKASMLPMKATYAQQIDFIDNMDLAIESLTREKSEHLKNINRMMAELLQILEVIKDQKVEEVNEHYSKELAKLRFIVDEQKRDTDRMEFTEQFAEAFINYSSYIDFLLHEKNVKNRIHMYSEERPTAVDVNHMSLIQSHSKSAENELSKCLGYKQVETRVWDSKEEQLPTNISTPSLLMEASASTDVILDLALAENGELLVLGCDSIECFSDKGICKGFLPVYHLKSAWNIICRGYDIYVSDAAGDKRCVYVMDMNKECAIKRTLKLSVPEQFWGGWALGLCFHVYGNFFIASAKTNMVYKVSSPTLHVHSATVTPFLTPEDQPEINCPHYICISPNYDIIISNNASSCIDVYSEEGEFKWSYKGNENGDSKLALNYPQGVGCDFRGNIYIADYNNHRIQIVSGDGTFIGVIHLPDKKRFPQALQIGKDDVIYVSHDFNEISALQIELLYNL